MNYDDLQNLTIEALEDLKANDVTVMDVRELTDIADTMIICTARSTRHATSIAQNVVTKAKQAKLKYVRMEGEREGEWVIVDLSDIIVHIMIPAAREFYNLEDLWEPVKVIREQKR